jgi:ElaB/YqjD/DUF883 family membrane-anchored ribosome-binding protein
MTEIKDKAAAKLNEARKKAGDAIKTAKAKASNAAATARTKAQEAAATARTRSADAMTSTKASARAAADKAATGIEHNPLVALVGGLAIGAIAAVLLPRTKQEDKAVGNIGSKVRETASSAIKNARETGKEQLDALGVNSGAAKDQMRELFEKITSAASSAASAASESIKKR